MKENTKSFILQTIKSKNNIHEENNFSFLIKGKPDSGKTFFFENNFLKDKEILDNYEIFKFNCFDLQEEFTQKMIKKIFISNYNSEKKAFKRKHKIAIKQFKFINVLWRMLILPLLIGEHYSTDNSLNYQRKNKHLTRNNYSKLIHITYFVFNYILLTNNLLIFRTWLFFWFKKNIK